MERTFMMDHKCSGLRMVIIVRTEKTNLSDIVEEVEDMMRTVTEDNDPSQWHSVDITGELPEHIERQLGVEFFENKEGAL